MSKWDEVPQDEDQLEKNPYYTKKGGKWIHNGLFWQPNVKPNFRNFYGMRKGQDIDYPLFDILEGKFQFESNCAQCHTLNLRTKSRGPYLRDVFNQYGRKDDLNQSLRKFSQKHDVYSLLSYMTDPSQFRRCMGVSIALVNTKEALAIIHYLMYLKSRGARRKDFVVDEDQNDYGNMYLPFRHKRYPEDYSEEEKKEMESYLQKTTKKRIEKRKQWQEIYGSTKYNYVIILYATIIATLIPSVVNNSFILKN